MFCGCSVTNVNVYDYANGSVVLQSLNHTALGTLALDNG